MQRFALVRSIASTIVLVCLATALQSCGQQGYSVIAVSATVIGVEVSQNPATQTPQAKLGYDRVEIAFVPTNRDAGDKAGGFGQGAKDAANVLMEIRYGGIFDLGASSGIYQRLAVGETAVKQPGASAMFAKDANGTIDKPTSDALTAALTSQQRADAATSATGILTADDQKIHFILQKVAPGGTLNTAALSTALDKSVGAPVNIVARMKTYTTAAQVQDALEVQDNSALVPLFNALSK